LHSPYGLIFSFTFIGESQKRKGLDPFFCTRAHIHKQDNEFLDRIDLRDIDLPSSEHRAIDRKVKKLKKNIKSLKVQK